MTMNQMIGATVMVGVFLSILLIAEVWYRTAHPAPETTRKFVHLSGGMSCLLFPVFNLSPLVVLCLAVLLSSVFVTARPLNVLKSIHGVERSSRGSEYYPLAILISYTITLTSPWIYVSSVLTLAVADAFAGLIGKEYGSIQFQVEGDTKSLQGSGTFFLIAFVVIAGSGFLFSNLSQQVVALSALLGAMLVTGFEFVSVRGTDNLFVPIALCVILARITTKPVTEIAFQNMSLLILAIGVGVLARTVRSFRTGEAITYILFAYATWSLGTLPWTLPVLFGLFLYVTLDLFLHGIDPDRYLGVRALFRAFLIPFSVLFFANVFDQYEQLLVPYLGAAAVVLFLTQRNAILRVKEMNRFGIWCLQGLSVLLSLAVVFAPIIYLRSLKRPVVLVGTAVLTIILVVLIEAGPDSWRDLPENRYWPAHYLLATFLAAGSGLLLQGIC